jgi:endonuclease YncB( thermonuclease family)
MVQCPHDADPRGHGRSAERSHQDQGFRCCLPFRGFVLGLRPAAGQDITGQATVIDGDTLEIHGQRIRLWGIDAPESEQLCRGSDSKPFRCGSVAALSLSDYITGRVVTCSPRGRDRYRRVLAVCFAGGVDLARWLVSGGLALDWPQYSRGAYSDGQAGCCPNSGYWPK